jgi:hypothetical protein
MKSQSPWSIPMVAEYGVCDAVDSYSAWLDDDPMDVRGDF